MNIEYTSLSYNIAYGNKGFYFGGKITQFDIWL